MSSPDRSRKLGGADRRFGPAIAGLRNDNQQSVRHAADPVARAAAVRVHLEVQISRKKGG